VIPQYREVFDICANRAAVRFEDGRTGVVDDSGTPLMVTDRCRRLRFLKGELLSVTKEDGSDCYTDLSGEAGGFFIRRHRVAAGGGDFP